MTQRTVQNGDTGRVVREKLNDNFTELYTPPGDGLERVGDELRLAIDTLPALP